MRTIHKQHRRGHVWAGLFLLFIGGLLMARQSGLYFPEWLFTWPMILISVGLFLGLRHGFRNPSWVISVFIGLVFLSDRIFPAVNLRPYIVPVILMGLGLLFLLRPKSSYSNRRLVQQEGDRSIPEQTVYEPAQESRGTRQDYLDATSIFGGMKKNILSKNFQGGEIINFMGGSEINLTQADFNGIIRIDTTNIFGGTKLFVPSHWDVQSDVVAIFGGVDDKRHLNGNAIDPKKLLVIEGTCLFGGIDIRSY